MTAAFPTRQPLRDARWMGEVLALAMIYFLTARLGLLMAIPGGHVTPVWPPSGIALAAVLLRGRRVWPGIWLGSFVANFWDFSGSPMSLTTDLATSATIGIGASLTALLGSLLLRRFVGERNPLERVLDVCAFMALGGVVSCLLSATVGVTALFLAGFAPWSGYGQAWLTWWLGDTAGVFIVAPLLLVWGGTRWLKSAARWAELFGGFGLLIAVTYYVFIENTTVLFTGKPLTFILIPFFVWPAVRFGRRGAATASGLIALLAVWGTIHNTGPFNVAPRDEALLLLELFLSVVVLTALCIAAVVTEREHVEAAQQRAVEELESRVRERTSALVQSEAQARQHLAEAERARAALLSILEDQQQTEAALRESQARTRLLIKSSNIGLWDWNLVTNEMFFSPEGKSQLGYADDEMPNQYDEWENRLHPEDREPTLRAVKDFCESRRDVYDLHFRMRHKDGSWRWILVRADLIHDAAGQPVRMMGCHIDITQRKTIEKALESAEEQYRSIFNNAVDGIFRTSPDGKFLVANPAAAHIFGFTSAEELIEERRDIAQQGYVDPRRREEFKRLLQEQGVVNGFECEMYRKDGSRVWISENTRAVHSPSGEVLYFDGIFEDVTERKQTEEALRESEERFRTIFEQAPLGISEGEIATARFINANQRYIDILGYTKDELQALTFKDYTHPEDLPKDILEFQKLAAGEIRTYAMEKRYIRKDGDIIWVNLTVAGLAKPGEKPVNCLAVVEDITERKQAEDLLRRSEEKFKALFDLAPVGIAFLDSRLNLVHCNPALERMSRLTREELLGGAWQRRTFLNADGSPRPPGERVTERAVNEKRLVNRVETGAVMESGDIAWAEVSVAPLALPDASAVVIMQDITERKRAAVQLEEANRQLRILSRQLFHIQEEERRHLARELHDEIGQTLTAAKINLKIIAPDVPARISGRLDDSIQLLDRLLRQVRDLSLDLRPPLLDELGLVPTLRWLVDQQAQRAGLRVTFTANMNGLEIDLAVQTTCFRVAQEAITNVVRHSGAKNIAIELQGGAERLTLRVRDDGAGFDLAVIQQRTPQDFSLGLVSMKERALLVHGGLEVHSAPGQGTEIRAWFPLAPGEHLPTGTT